jgi:hypothetical protein
MPSQDAEAAQEICEALRAAAIEVWFDKSELRGGDAWDQTIRHQIRDCALFIPIISGHTQARGGQRPWTALGATLQRTLDAAINPGM